MAKRESPEPGTIGSRILAIREELGMDTVEFANALNRLARKLGHEETWSSSKVSRASNNAHRLKLDEAIDIVSAAKTPRSLDWLVFGIEVAATARFKKVAGGGKAN